ncbi:PAS-domain containing protein [Roseomonas sp. USHLN139]|uniref:PAS-domain containing protein n=1 Tax=Roseomonas sp. USHLN139 TaxID=3081298 RepID=UPI003B02C8CD
MSEDGRDAALALLQALPGPVLVFGADHRLVVANAAALALLELPPGTLPTGLPAGALIRRLADRGHCGPGDPERLAAQAGALDRRQPHRSLVQTGDDRWSELASLPLPGGGWASITTDVTEHRRAEFAARERLRLTDTALRQSPSGIGIYDRDHHLVFFNDAYEALLDLPAGTIQLGMSFDRLVDRVLENLPLDAAGRALFGSRRHLDRSQRSQLVRQRPDGSAVLGTSQPLAEGGFLVVLEDVSQLRAAEEEAKARAALVDGVLAALPHGVCVYGPDRRLRLANAAFRELVGTSEVRIGEHLLDLIRRREAEREYADRQDPEEIFRRQFDFARAPTTRCRADGRVLTGRTAPLPDGGHISVVSDVTALHRAEAEAQRRADLLQAMMESMRHGVCLFDAGRRVVAANALACTLTGLTREELVPGAQLDDLGLIQLARGALGDPVEGAALYRDRAGGVARHDSFTRHMRDGRVVEVSTDPTPDGGFVRVYTDVTAERQAMADLERARTAAEEASFAKTRFLATMSHELRTPLHAVIGFAEALLDERSLDNVQEFATTILEAGRELLALIDAVLAVAQMGSGRLQVETRPLHLPSVLEGIARQMRGPAEAAGLALDLELPPALPRARAEERRLRQILLSLLNNAIKFTPPGGRLSLAARDLGDGHVEISVADDGIGMAPERLEQAFEAFVQLEGSHDRRYGGPGLGLYLARALAEAMQARLTLESARGAGTTARLILKAASPAFPAPAA